MRGAGQSDELNAFSLSPASGNLHPLLSDQGGSRTHKHEALDLVALPVCVPSHDEMAGSGVAPDGPGL